MERADIKIGFGCNNHCKFCVQGDKRNYCVAKKEEEVKNALEEAHKLGKREVVFTGGEPCMHPKILKLIKLARNIGFEEVQLQSNGRMFAYMGFCIQAIQAGTTQFSPALHGHNAKIHDFLTAAKGSFDQTVQGIKNLKELNQYVLTNTVITSTNAKHLPKIAQLLVDLGVNQYQFAFIHLGGTAFKNRDWIVPRKSEIMKYVHRGLDVGIKAGRKAMTEAIPYCLMRGYEDYIAEKIIPNSSVYDAGFVIQEYARYRKDRGKVKRSNCSKCKYNDVCEGPWREYPEIFGWNEFTPVLR